MPDHGAARTILQLGELAALLALVAVAAGLALPDAMAAVPPSLRPGAYSQETITVLAALGLLWTGRRLRAGWHKGWLLWPGLVGYLVYAYGLFAFDGVLNPVFPLYLAILALSSFALVLFLRRVDPAAVRVQPGMAPPRRGTALLLGLLVVLFGVLWSAMLLPALSGTERPEVLTILVLDLAFALPITALAAVLLWRRHPAGDLFAVPLLVKVATLGLSVFLGTAYAPLFFGGPFMPGELALYALMGFGPLLLIRPFWRALSLAGLSGTLAKPER